MPPFFELFLNKSLGLCRKHEFGVSIWRSEEGNVERRRQKRERSWVFDRKVVYIYGFMCVQEFLIENSVLFVQFKSTGRILAVEGTLF